MNVVSNLGLASGVQIVGFKTLLGPQGFHYRLYVSDGVHSDTFAMLVKTVADDKPSMETLAYHSLIMLEKLIPNALTEKQIILIMDMTVVEKHSAVGQVVFNPVQYLDPDKKAATADNVLASPKQSTSSFTVAPGSTYSFSSKATVLKSSEPKTNAETYDTVCTGKWKYGTVSVEELQTIDENREHDSVLLVDCRAAEDFYNQKILRFDCVNIPSTPEVDSVIDSLVTTTTIVQFIQKHCSGLLRFLNAPGFYKNIIVFDEASTTKSCSKFVISILGVISKWNENTGTAVQLLEGGFSAIRSQGMDLLQPSYDPVWIARMLNDGKPWQFESSSVKRNYCNSDPCVTDDLTARLDYLKVAVIHCKDLLVKLKARKSLTGVKLVLTREDEDKANDFLDLVPNEMKCPVCFEVFTGEIFQCLNGHCICSGCCTNISLCPECRAAYSGRKGGKVRNRALEVLMTTSLHIECPFRVNGCLVKLTYNQVATHLKICDFRKSMVISQLDEEILTLENEIDAIFCERVRLASAMDISEVFSTARDPIHLGLMAEIFCKALDYDYLKNQVAIVRQQS